MRKEIKNHWHTWIFLVALGTVLIVIYKALDSIGYLGGFISNFLSVFFKKWKTLSNTFHIISLIFTIFF